jgi:hypothetical protein
MTSRSVSPEEAFLHGIPYQPANNIVWPHLMVNCDAPWPLALVYAAPETARDAEHRIPRASCLLYSERSPTTHGCGS